MSENIATGEEVKVVEEGGTKSPAPADTQAEPTNDPSDITSSKRWKRNRVSKTRLREIYLVLFCVYKVIV